MPQICGDAKKLKHFKFWWYFDRKHGKAPLIGIYIPKNSLGYILGLNLKLLAIVHFSTTSHFVLNGINKYTAIVVVMFTFIPLKIEPFKITQ